MGALLFLILCCVLLGLIPAKIAEKKGRDFNTWWLYGACLFIVALIQALLMDSTEEKRLKRAALEQLATGNTPMKPTGLDFIADGVMDGVPYSKEPDGGLVAIISGHRIKFRNIEDLRAAITARPA